MPDQAIEFEGFIQRASGHGPYPFQSRVARDGTDCWRRGQYRIRLHVVDRRRLHCGELWSHDAGVIDDVSIAARDRAVGSPCPTPWDFVRAVDLLPVHSAYLRRPTGGDTATKGTVRGLELSDAYPGSGYRADEFYRPGGWTNEYVGKTYGMSDTKLWGPKDTPGAVNHGYELFTMGMVGIMFGNHDPWADADLRRYVLGILGIV